MSAAQLADAGLVARCRTGDQDAWYALVERFSRYVYAITTQVYRLSLHDAEDVFQEVFARTYEHLGRLRSDAAIRAWIGQLTRRLCVDSLRQSWRERPGDGNVQIADSEDAFAKLDEALLVRDALATLPADCQQVLDRFFCRDESYETIAVALGLPAGTVASRISRCLVKLRLPLAARNN